jgi:hypothetical protein
MADRRAGSRAGALREERVGRRYRTTVEKPGRRVAQEAGRRWHDPLFGPPRQLQEEVTRNAGKSSQVPPQTRPLCYEHAAR